MKILFLFLAFIVAEEEEVAVEEEVTVDLKTENFDDFVKGRNVLVEFFAPWCGHCKALKPKWEAAAVKVNQDDSIDATIAKVDAVSEDELAKRYGVEGYPTIKWFPKGSLKGEDYDGKRETADIVEFVVGETTPAIFTISKKQFAEFGKASDYALVSTVKADTKKENYFDRACKRLKKAMAEIEKTFQCGKTRLKKGKTKVFLRRNKFEENDGPVELKYEGKMSKLDVWVKDNIFGQFGFFEKGFLFKRRDEELFLIVLNEETNPSEIDGLGDFVNKMKQERGIQANMLASKNAEKWGFPEPKDVLYVYFKIKDKSTKKENLRPTDYDRYLLDPSVDNTDFDTFLSKASTVGWERYLKSQSPDDVKQEGLVVPLIGKTFDEVVFDSTKDVLVEFYAPWCGHCKSFAPKYEKLATIAKRQFKNRNLMIAKIDGDANETPVDVSGFPTIYFFPAGKDSKPIKYEGDRDIEDLLDFIDDYATSVKSGIKDEL